MNRAVFLDRDGVVNEAVVRAGKPYPPAVPEEVTIAAGVNEGLAALKKSGFQLIVITNQPDVARGTVGREQVEAIHAMLRASLPIDDFFVCYHDDSAECACRKPRPGLLVEAAKLRGIELRRSYMIGDRWRDVDAGNAAGCTTILIDCSYAERRSDTAPDVRVTSFAEAARWILNVHSYGEDLCDLAQRFDD